MNIFGKKSPPTGQVIGKSIRKLEVQKNKISRVHFRLQKRDEKLFQVCVKALKDDDKGKAQILANEVAEVKRLLKFLHDVELAIERVIIRLETVRELSDIMVDLKPALRTLRGVSEELFDFLPDVSSELSDVDDAITETLYSTRVTTDGSTLPMDKTTPGGEEVLKEVSQKLEQEAVEKLPEPPANLEPPATLQPPEKIQEKTPVKQMVALSATCSQTVGEKKLETENFSSRNIFSLKEAEVQEFSLEVEEEIEEHSLENDLLDYVKDKKGMIDLDQCSVDLDASYSEIEDALHRLDDKGKIVLESRSN
ncbi:MAG: hypothetical protein ACOC6G_00050 [Thermoproteota archaeon]